MVAGGGPMARLPRLIGRGRALEVLLGSDDIRGDLAEAYGYVNRSLPDAELDAFVDALATRIGSFDKWAISIHEAPGERRQPTRGRRNCCWLGCLHRIGRASGDTSENQGLDGARIPQAGRRRDSPGLLLGAA